MGPIEAKRINFDNLAIPARSSVAYDNPLVIPLVICQETVDEEVESNGTNIAQVPLYSKIVGMKLNLQLFNNAATGGDRIRWALVKYPDGENLMADLSDTYWHNSDDNPTMREIRATTLSMGFTVASDRTARALNIFVRRKTLQRLGKLRENDRLALKLAVSGTGAAAISGFGTLYARMN